MSYTSPFSAGGCEGISLCKLGLTSRQNSQELPRLGRASRQRQVWTWMPLICREAPLAAAQGPAAAPSVSLPGRGITEDRTMREWKCQWERQGGHNLFPPELDFRALKRQRLWGTIQDTPRHCTHSKARDSESQDCRVPISKIYGASKETQDDRALVHPHLLSKGNKCNYCVPGVLKTQSE